jgi:hypothetical protein
MPRIWVAGDVKTNPIANATLVETGTLNEREHNFRFIFYMTAGAYLLLEEVGVALNILKSQVLPPVLGNQTLKLRFRVTKSSTIRLRTKDAVTGDIQVSILHD